MRNTAYKIFPFLYTYNGCLFYVKAYTTNVVTTLKGKGMFLSWHDAVVQCQII